MIPDPPASYAEVSKTSVPSLWPEIAYQVTPPPIVW